MNAHDHCVKVSYDLWFHFWNNVIDKRVHHHDVAWSVWTKARHYNDLDEEIMILASEALNEYSF